MYKSAGEAVCDVILFGCAFMIFVIIVVIPLGYYLKSINYFDDHSVQMDKMNSEAEANILINSDQSELMNVINNKIMNCTEKVVENLNQKINKLEKNLNSDFDSGVFEHPEFDIIKSEGMRIVNVPDWIWTKIKNVTEIKLMGYVIELEQMMGKRRYLKMQVNIEDLIGYIYDEGIGIDCKNKWNCKFQVESWVDLNTYDLSYIEYIANIGASVYPYGGFEDRFTYVWTFDFKALAPIEFHSEMVRLNIHILFYK